MQKYYKHWSLVPKEEWFWPNFTPKELASKGNGSVLIDYDAMYRLQIMRNIIGKPFHITSAYRDPLHNARVGGSPNSFHKKGKAFDISLAGHTKRELKKAATAVGFGGIAFARSFIHVDTGRRRTWTY